MGIFIKESADSAKDQINPNCDFYIRTHFLQDLAQ